MREKKGSNRSGTMERDAAEEAARAFGTEGPRGEAAETEPQATSGERAAAEEGATTAAKAQNSEGGAAKDRIK